MSYLERLDARAAMKAEGEPSKGSKGGFDPFAGDPRAHIPELPAACAAGLRSLRSMLRSRLVRPDFWPLAVSDALALERDGWAIKALALGWSPLDLFGAVIDRDGHADADGLAVWLGGRPVLAICETHASVDDGNGRAYFNRCNRLGTTLLWEIGQ